MSRKTLLGKMGTLLKLVLMLAVTACGAQRDPTLPLSFNSFQRILRSKVPVPAGRFTSTNDIIIRHYSTNTTKPKKYRIGEIKRLLSDPNFDSQMPTVLYAHGYVELYTDDSITRVTEAYLENGGYNVLLLDWSNLAFGDYLVSALGLQTVGNETGKAIWRLLKGGLSLEGLHLVGHSMGAHVLGGAARHLKARGFEVPRLTGLDPAYPGFYPPLLAPPLSARDAAFVDVVHTDGGGFGAPGGSGHADFWPNGGVAKQPGCLTATVPFTNEDFCSHWRSWEYWSESLTGGQFLARNCDNYDAFLRGSCSDQPLVYMGVGAKKGLYGNFYLRTAAKAPYALGNRGAE